MPESDLFHDDPVETDEPVQHAKESPENTKVASAPVRRKRSIFDDRLVRVLVGVSVALVILFLVTIMSAMLTGVLGSGQATTGLQRDIALLSQKTAQNPKDLALWHSYVSALIDDGQYRKAQSVIDAVSKSTDQSSGQDLLTAQAELYYATKKYDKAIQTAELVQKKIKPVFDAARKKEGTPEWLGSGINGNYWQVLLIKAEALSKLKKNSEAVKALDEYLKVNTGAADVLTRRGELKVLAGDKAGAAEDFRLALTYIPDDARALENLKKIGAKQ